MFDDPGSGDYDAFGVESGELVSGNSDGLSPVASISIPSSSSPRHHEYGQEHEPERVSPIKREYAVSACDRGACRDELWRPAFARIPLVEN